MELRLQKESGQIILIFPDKVIIKDNVLVVYRKDKILEYPLDEYRKVEFKDNNWMGR